MAWGYLAHAQLSTMFWQPFDVASPLAIPAYERALALDPEQSEALVTKALVVQILEHDWEAAGKLYQRAIGAGGSLYALVNYSSFFLLHIGQNEKAIERYSEAEKRDPLHAGYKSGLAGLYVQNGNPEAALRKAREALELEPQHHFALMALIEAYTATGNYAGAQHLLEKLPATLLEHPRIRVRFALNYVSQGDYVKAREIYQELLGLDLARSSQAIAQISVLAVKLGEVEKAIDLMETAVDLNMWNQFWTASWPWLRQNEALKNHPRYLAHLRRMRLDDESLAELHRRMSFD
jgi:tetratricopeptide (TPR) repeat protein